MGGENVYSMNFLKLDGRRSQNTLIIALSAPFLLTKRITSRRCILPPVNRTNEVRETLSTSAMQWYRKESKTGVRVNV